MATLERVRVGAVDRLTKARAMCLLARVAWETGHPRGGRDAGARGLRAARARRSAGAAGRAPHDHGGVLLNDLQASATHSEEALALLSSGMADPDPRLLAAAMVEAASTDFLIGRGLDEERYLARGRARGADGGAPAGGGRAGLPRGRPQVRRPDRRGPRRPARAPRAGGGRGRELGARTRSATCPQLEMWAGDWDAAEAWARRHVELAERMGQTAQLRQANFNLALARRPPGRERGGAGAGRGAPRRGRESDGDTVERGERPWACSAWCARIDGDAARRGRRTCGRWNDIYLEIGLLEPGRRRLMGDYLEALVGDRGDGRGGGAPRRASRRCRATLDRPSGLGQAARVRALLRAGEGDLDGALDAVAEGLAAYERVDLPFDRARLRLVEGGLHRRTRQKRSARTALEDAQRTFLDLGAAHVRGPGGGRARPHRPGSGRHASTSRPTERRIAGLLAEGRTVKAVAELAFMSPKTVEAHLTRVYRKLGINSRAELGARLAQDAGRPISRGSPDSPGVAALPCAMAGSAPSRCRRDRGGSAGAGWWSASGPASPPRRWPRRPTGIDEASERAARFGFRARRTVTTYVPAEETVMWLFEADGEESLRVLARQAEVRFDRVLPVVTSAVVGDGAGGDGCGDGGGDRRRGRARIRPGCQSRRERRLRRRPGPEG